MTIALLGNLIVPNDSYCKFEAWFAPLLHRLHDEQERDGRQWTPSALIRRFGQEINDENSVYYWCYKVQSKYNLLSFFVFVCRMNE